MSSQRGAIGGIRGMSVLEEQRGDAGGRRR